jgi:hypothetical protein
MMYGAARVRHLRIGRRVIRAAGVARCTQVMHVNFVFLLRQGGSPADCRADEERQQADNRNEIQERVLHVSIC